MNCWTSNQKKKKNRSDFNADEEFIKSMIICGLFDDLWLDEVLPTQDLKFRREGRSKKANYWSDTRWGKYFVNDELMLDPTTKLAREVRRKFRRPFPVFMKIVVPECERLNVFETRDVSRRRIPTEFKILICLRIMGRGAYHDDIAEMSFSFKSTCQHVFRQFIRNFTPAFYSKFIYYPTGARRKKIMDTYAKIGLHGCVGSMDATHVFWAWCPEKLHNLCIGKEKKPQLLGTVLLTMLTASIMSLISFMEQRTI